MTYALRRAGLALAIGIAAALALGVALALAQGESVLLWFAYMLYMAGALAIAFAIFSGAPTSARKAVAKRYLAQSGAQQEEVVEGPTVISDLMLFVAAGLVLIALGTIIELAGA